MRILMLDNEFPPLGGGMGTVNRGLLECYAGRPELEIDLITSALGRRQEVEQFAERIRIIKVPVWNRNIHHSTCRELILYSAQALPQSLKRHRVRPYDFCLAWSTLPAGAVALALHRLVTLPYIVWVSGPDIPGFELRYRVIYPFLSPTIRRVWRKARYVVAKCAGEIEMIHALDSSVNVRFIPNGVDPAAFRPGPAIPDDGPLHVVCVARLIERKGQGHLLEAIKRLMDSGINVVLTLIGTGDSQRDYEDQARKLDIQDRVRFVGYVPREEINAYYNSAHVFALPSYNEGMALAVLEAMAAGLPLVVTRTGGTAELVEEGVNGYSFNWGDIDGLTNYLRMFAQDRGLARRMGAASHAHAACFTWDAIADLFLKLFKQIISKSPTLPPDLKAESERHLKLSRF
jgi:phosphatidylinositol alpha-1,6-mannosyltransferase